MKTSKAYNGRNVYIVDGNRSPFLKVRGKPGPFTAANLAVNTARTLLERQTFSPTDIDQVITGCMVPSPDEANISRIIALRLGCGDSVPAWTVQRNCGSGLQAIDNAADTIATGQSDLILAGGVEVMSHAPLLLNHDMTEWFSKWSQAKKIWTRLSLLTKLRPHFFLPVISLLHGLTDPVVGLSMGQTAEILAYRFQITRKEMDKYALMSHQRLAEAQASQAFPEVSTIYDTYGKYYTEDDGVRRDTSLEALAKLKPVYDKKYGLVTAGNSSQVTDGAAFLIIASEEAVKRHNLKVQARIVDTQWVALDPAVMGLGPVYALAPLLTRNKLTLPDIDYFEINEAFAAQVLACQRALQDPEFCQTQLNLPEALGTIDIDRLNIHGGAIAQGHPIAASGARLVLQLLTVLKNQNARRGMAALCVGGGQGGAMLVERTETVETAEKEGE